MLEKTYYAADYADEVAENPAVTSEEIEARYAENPDDFDTVSFRYFYISVSAGEDEDETEAAKNAKLAAEAMATAENEQEFMDYALENTSEDKREDYDADASTKANRISYSSINSGYVDWLYDEARTEGDTYVYESAGEEKVNGYYVLYYIGRDDIRYDTINVRHILITPEQDEEGNVTDEAKQAAKTKAEELLAEWKAGEATEDSFADLAAANTADSNASTGGLYENVTIGQMVPTFNDWCFAASRRTGDTGIVETDYGYHVMYFVGKGVNNFENTVGTVIENERYQAWLEESLANYTEEMLSGMKYACNM